MTGAYLMTKTDNGHEPVEVEYLSKEERRRHLKSRNPEEVMRWMDLMCEKIVEAETLLTELENEGLITRRDAPLDDSNLGGCSTAPDNLGKD